MRWLLQLRMRIQMLLGRDCAPQVSMTNHLSALAVRSLKTSPPPWHRTLYNWSLLNLGLHFGVTR
ncbi:MAG: hypothetical protein WA815_17670, partial [Terracidiphilus sp.]